MRPTAYSHGGTHGFHEKKIQKVAERSWIYGLMIISDGGVGVWCVRAALGWGYVDLWVFCTLGSEF